MTSTQEKDYIHANERGNGPKARMEGGDQTDDISINDPDTRSKTPHQHTTAQSDVLASPKDKKDTKPRAQTEAIKK